MSEGVCELWSGNIQKLWKLSRIPGVKEKLPPEIEKEYGDILKESRNKCALLNKEVLANLEPQQRTMILTTLQHMPENHRKWLNELFWRIQNMWQVSSEQIFIYFTKFSHQVEDRPVHKIYTNRSESFNVIREKDLFGLSGQGVFNLVGKNKAGCFMVLSEDGTFSPVHTSEISDKTWKIAEQAARIVLNRMTQGFGGMVLDAVQQREKKKFTTYALALNQLFRPKK